MDDPIFEPWSADDERAPARLLRATAVPRLEEIGRRLRAARHTTAVQDLLEEDPSLLRFTLTPWGGPFTGSAGQGAAMLEIGLDTRADTISVWSWLDRASEAPEVVAEVPVTKVTRAWIDRLALEFVQRVLGLH